MRKPILVLVVSSIVLATPAFAQRSTGSIRGTVRDATQSVLPGATVTVVNEETGLSRNVVTNAAGVYSVPILPVGRYQLFADFDGLAIISEGAGPVPEIKVVRISQHIPD